VLNIKKLNRGILRVIENNKYTTKIQIYFSSKTSGDYFDSYEKNYTHVNQNPLTIKGYVTEISPEALVWKQYGLSEMGMKEIICDKKYASWFRLATKISIDGDFYQTYKENQSGKFLITELPLNIIKVVVYKVK
jgi:hypothetical protein